MNVQRIDTHSDTYSIEPELDAPSARLHTVLVWIICISVCVVLAGMAGVPLGPARVLAGIVTSLFAPGYAALMATGFVKLPGGVNHLIFSIPVSLAISILAGIALNFSPFGVRLEPMGFLLCFVCVALLALAWLKQRRILPASEPASATSIPFSLISAQEAEDRRERAAVGRVRRAFSPRVIVILALLAGASVAAALWTGYGVLTASQDIPMPFTEFYTRNTPTIDPKDGQSSEVTVELAINNKETHPMTYLVQLFVKPSTGGTLAAGEITVSLQDGETWQGSFPVTAGCDDQIAAQLLVPGQESAYRSLHITPECQAAPTSEPTP